MKDSIKIISGLIFEFMQASGFAACVSFIIAFIVDDRQALAMGMFFGGVPVMLAKRFVISFLREVSRE